MNIARWTFLALLTLQFNSSLLSQAFEEFQGFAINPKLGPAFTTRGANDLPSVGLEINLLKGHTSYALEYISHNFLDQNQLGVMLGKYKGDNYFRIHYQAGINLFWGEYATSGTTQPWIGTGGEPRSSFTTVGVISKVGLKFIPLAHLSIGVDLMLNVNPETTLLLPMVSIEVGTLRRAVQGQING